MADLGGVVAVLYSMARVGEGGGEALGAGGMGALGGLTVGGSSPWVGVAADPFLRPSVPSVRAPETERGNGQGQKRKKRVAKLSDGILADVSGFVMAIWRSPVAGWQITEAQFS